MRSWFALFAKLFPAQPRRSVRSKSARLLIERLEDRTVPSVSPTLLTPAAGATSTNPTFTWSTVTGATSYDFWLTDETLGTTVSTQTGLINTTFTLPGPLNQTDVFEWTARADNGNGPMGPYATPITFTTDGALVNPSWLNEMGNYTFSVNQTTALGHGATNTAVLAGVNMSNVSVSADVNLTSANQYAGLISRYQGSGDTDMYFARLLRNNNGTVNAAIDVNVNGVWTQIGTSENVSGNGGTLTFQTQGNDLKLFLNGNLVAYAQDSTYASGTVGIRSSLGVTLSSFAATEADQTLASLPFTDNFTTTSFGNQLSSSWTEEAGNFNLSTGAAVSQGTAAGLAIVNGVNTAAANVQASVVFNAANQYAGLVARYSGPGDSNMYFARLLYLGNGQSSAAIYRNLNGVWSQIGSGVTVSASSGTLDFQANGATLDLYLNGILVAAAQDSNFSTGAVGMRDGGAAITNFQASTDVNPAGNWTNQAGIINLNTGTAITSLGAGGTATLNGSAGANVLVQGNVTLTAANQYAGLVARYAGPGDTNMYFGRLVDLGNGTVNAAIYRSIGGVWTQIGASQTVSASGGALAFQVEGNDLKLFLNNNLVAYAQDSLLSGGLSGIRAYGGATVANFQTGAATLTAATNPFADNFSDPSTGNQLSYSWEEQAGNFNLATNAAVGQTATSNLATVNGLDFSTANVQATATLSAVGQYAGLVARYTASSMYFADVTALANNKYQAAIFKYVGGAWVTLASTTLSSFNGSMQFQVSGSRLAFSVNGMQVLATNDSSIAGPGLVGMRSSQGAAFNTFGAAGS